jgi:RNA polymerase sigma-70 factor (ECF subfamily)
VRNRAEAEDILQETYVKVWQNAGQYRSTAHGAMAWLATVARNSAIDRLRRNPRPAADLDAALDFASQDPTPEAAAISASRRRQLDDCLKTTDAAEAIRGAYLEGHSYEDLARHFGVPLNTMKTRLRRGLMKLKDCLGHDA